MREDDALRINLYLSRAGICSRREADVLVTEGRVTIDGKTAGSGCKVMPGQVVCLDGRPVGPSAEKVILAVNKPRGVVCTTDRRWGDRILEDLVDCPGRVFSAGRLDKDSEGLILMTNQGDLVDRIMRSSHGHEKEYIVTVDREVDEAFLARLGQGVFLPELGVKTRPCKVRKTGSREFHMILTQGLNRQIRRMCRTCGYKVVRLIRIRIMNICLGDLPVGKWRYLTQQETKDLYALSRMRRERDGKERI